MVNLPWKDQLFGIASICLNGYNNSDLETDFDSRSNYSCFFLTGWKGLGKLRNGKGQNVPCNQKVIVKKGSGKNNSPGH